MCNCPLGLDSIFEDKGKATVSSDRYTNISQAELFIPKLISFFAIQRINTSKQTHKACKALLIERKKVPLWP